MMTRIQRCPAPGILLLIVLTLLFGVNSAQAAAGVSSGVSSGVSIEELTTWLGPLTQFEAKFEQQSFNEAGVLTETSAGQMAIARPGRFRWDYTTPFEQTILADGQQLWIYDIEMEQITVRALDDSVESLPSVLLSGEVEEILQKFTVTRIRSGNNTPSDESPSDQSVALAIEAERGLTIELTLVPSLPSEALARIRLLLTAHDHYPEILEIYDPYGRLTKFVFSKYHRLSEIDFDRFKMQIPPGVDVVGQPQ